MAPSLYHFEASNVFWKYHCHHDIPLPQSEKSLHQVVSLVDEFLPAGALFEEVFQMACLVEHVTYDIFYLAVALREAGLLITLDQDLQKLARKRGVETLPD